MMHHQQSQACDTTAVLLIKTNDFSGNLRIWVGPKLDFTRTLGDVWGTLAQTPNPPSLGPVPGQDVCAQSLEAIFEAKI